MTRRDGARAWSPAVAIGLAVASAGLCASCAGGGSDPGSVPPSVETLGALTISETEEALSGSVNPNGKDAEYWFEWGGDESLADAARTSPSPLAATATAQTVTATLTGLAKGAHFHWRLAASNADGTARGQVKPFHHYASVVFVSSARGTGDLGSWPDAGGRTGLAAGDSVCQRLAQRAGLQGGPFQAWLSDPSTASRRLAHSAGPYVRADGARVAASWSAMTSVTCAAGTGPCLEQPIATNERGGLEAASAVYTSTHPDGSTYAYWPSTACARWTSAAGDVWAAAGSSLATDRSWTTSAVVRCSASLPLYCLQQNPSVPQELFSTGCLWATGVPWAVSACGNGLNQDPECAAVCCGFWSASVGCVRTSFYVGAYRITSCRQPSPGLFTMDVTHAGRAFTASCRTWEPTVGAGVRAAIAVPPRGLRERVRLLVERALGAE